MKMKDPVNVSSKKQVTRSTRRMKMGTATHAETRAEVCLVTEPGRIKVTFFVAANNLKRSGLVGRNEFPL